MIQFNNGGCICLIRRTCSKKRGNMRNVDVKYNSRDTTEGSSVHSPLAPLSFPFFPVIF